MKARQFNDLDREPAPGNRYEVRVIRDAGAGIGGLEDGSPLATFAEFTDAHQYAESEATRYELGCAVVDTEMETIDWGDDPSDAPTVMRFPHELLTDFWGQRIN